MAYKVGTLQKPVDTRNVELCNAAFKPVVDAINNSRLLVLQDTVNVADRHYWLNYYKFKDHPNKGMRITIKFDTFATNSNYYLDVFDWTDDLNINSGVPDVKNKAQIFYCGSNDFGAISWLYEEGSALQIYSLSVFYIKSPDGKNKLLAGTYVPGGNKKHAGDCYEFLNGLGRTSYMIPYNNQQGQNQIIAVAYLSFANQYYTDKIYAGSRAVMYTTYNLVHGQKYRMTDIETGRSETIYYMYPHFFREV